MGKVINILILLGAVSFLVAIVQKLCGCELPFAPIPTTFLKFSITSLILAIALSVKK